MGVKDVVSSASKVTVGVGCARAAVLTEKTLAAFEDTEFLLMLGAELRMVDADPLSAADACWISSSSSVCAGVRLLSACRYLNVRALHALASASLCSFRCAAMVLRRPSNR